MEVTPPVAAKHPHAVTSPHGTREDPYYWLRDDTRKDPAVLAYLEAENAYGAKMLAPAKPLEDKLVAEMSARVDENESTVPVLEDGYWYWTRYEAGKQRPIYMRRKDGGSAEVLLDANQLATGHSFYAIGDYAVTRDGKLLAWTDDSVGRNQFELHIRNLETGVLFADGEHAIAPSVEWANDNKTLFIVGKDPTTLREDRVLRHPLGGKTELAYQEANAAYYVDIHHLKSRKYIAITLDETTTSETRLIDADAPNEPPTVFRARKEDVRYDIEHIRNFVMRTNEGAPNFKLVEIQFGVERPLMPARDAFIEDFAAYRNFVAVEMRRDGLKHIELVEASRTREIRADERPSTMSLIDTPDVDAHSIRYAYESLVTPETTYEIDVDTQEKRLLKRDKVPTYDATKYKTEYRHAGRVPISIVYRKDTKLDGTAPLLVFGYGAYGDTLDPTFDRTPVSLLDRGWVYAIAHVRGGEELGQSWYDDGRLLAKKHTFEDFIAVTEYLIANKYGNRAYAEGASAGGLLMGAIANMRPDLYRGIVAWVPFVDVVTTMLDASIPLVTNEYDEWGDPTDKTAYDYMLSYSPYDNVGPHPYPALYVRSGLWDSQVQYYEPAKWVAKLRATKRDDNLLVLETDMHAGHEGSSGRFEAIREYARAYAFMLYVDGGATARQRR